MSDYSLRNMHGHVVVFAFAKSSYINGRLFLNQMDYFNYNLGTIINESHKPFSKEPPVTCAKGWPLGPPTTGPHPVNSGKHNSRLKTCRVS
jgi:hypothetical protein